MSSNFDWHAVYSARQHENEAYSQHNYRATPHASGRIPPLRHLAEDVLNGAKPQLYEAIGSYQRDKRRKAKPEFNVDTAFRYMKKIMNSDDEFENRNLFGATY